MVYGSVLPTLFASHCPNTTEFHRFQRQLGGQLLGSMPVCQPNLCPASNQLVSWLRCDMLWLTWLVWCVAGAFWIFFGPMLTYIYILCWRLISGQHVVHRNRGLEFGRSKEQCHQWRTVQEEMRHATFRKVTKLPLSKTPKPVDLCCICVAPWFHDFIEICYWLVSSLSWFSRPHVGCSEDTVATPASFLLITQGGVEHTNTCQDCRGPSLLVMIQTEFGPFYEGSNSGIRKPYMIVYDWICIYNYIYIYISTFFCVYIYIYLLYTVSYNAIPVRCLVVGLADTPLNVQQKLLVWARHFIRRHAWLIHHAGLEALPESSQ